MKKYFKSYPILLIGIVSLMLLIVYSGLSTNTQSIKSPLASGGTLHLTNWDFATLGEVPLNGEWEFYWQQLLNHDDFLIDSLSAPRLTGYVAIPSTWQGQIGDTKLSTTGYATYRLKVKVKPSNMTWGLKIENIRSAHSLFVNGDLHGQNGIPTATQDGFVGRNVPYMTFFQINGDTAEIIIQVANHEYVSGGFALPAFLGSQENILARDNQQSRFELIIAAAIFTIGIYHLSIFLYQRQQRSDLLFGLYCLCMAVIKLTHDQKLLCQFFPEMSFNLWYGFKTLCITLSVITITLFLREIVQDILPRAIVRLVLYCCISYAAAVVLLPLSYYTLVDNYFFMIHVFIYLCYSVILLKALHRQKYTHIRPIELQILIVAFFYIVLAYTESFLYVQAIQPNRIIWMIGVTAYVFSLSFILSFRFYTAYSTIQAMSNRLLELDKVKDEFLINTSHEIKTPLHAIMNISQSMLEEATACSTSDQNNKLQLIVNMSQRLTNLTNDILDIAKLKNHEIQLHPVNIDIYAGISSSLEVFRHLLQGKDIKLLNQVSPATPHVWCDRNRGIQVLYNLIGNAIKFTVTGEIILSAMQHGSRLHISIQDTGVGIMPKDQERIFAPYEQVSTGISREFNGTGIGLTITKHLVNLMGGEIWVEWSELGKGTKVTFSLPISSSTAADSKLTEQSFSMGELLMPLAMNDTLNANEDKYPTILAVDDEIINLQVISSIFSQDRLRILTATNGKEALQMLAERHDIDLILLDIMMPSMSGYEVCREIRKTYSLFEMPIVMLTVRNTLDDLTTGFEVGANDFITKPFSGAEIRARVKTLLDLKIAVQSSIQYEMAFLQAQIKPHFFYNVLNTIISFCYTDSIKAGKLLAEFSNYLRRSFDVQDNLSLITIENELDLVRSYVEIEKARFGNRLRVGYDIDPTLLSYYVPPLVIQPLIENAILHGLMAKITGAEVILRVYAVERDIQIEIIDNGIGIPQEKIALLLDLNPSNRGVGLFNINLRLRKLFGRTLHIVSREGEGTTIKMQIPRKTSPK